MSNVSGSEMRVPIWQLIIFIVFILAAGVTAYIFWDESARLEEQLKSAKDSLEGSKKTLISVQKQLDDLYAAVGFSTTEQIKSALGQFEPKVLDKLIADKLDKRAKLIDAIGMNPSDVDAEGKSKFLKSTIDASLASGKLEDPKLQGKLVGNLIEQLIRRDKALADLKTARDEGEKAVGDVNAKIDAKKAEIIQKFTEMDGKIKDQRDKVVVARDKYRFEPRKWDVERADLEQKQAAEESISRKFARKLEMQKSLVSPIDGKIVAYDWQTRRGTLNLGARDMVKAGYEFDVFSLRPGPDRADKRVYHGKIKLVDVKPESSLFVVVPSQWDSKDHPIIVGDVCTSQLYDETRPKTFAIAGWFPKGGDFSREAIAGVITRNGGVVQPELALDTDFLVVGVITEEGLTAPSEAAKVEIADGLKAYEDAHRYFTQVLTVDKFLKYMNRSGSGVTPQAATR
jgi:hypothetical protein